MFIKSIYIIINESDKSVMFKGKRKDNDYKVNFSKLDDHKVLYLLSMNDENGFGIED